MANAATDWTKGSSSEDEKKKLLETLRASTSLIYRMLELLDERQTWMLKKNWTELDFDTPNYACRQAFRNGTLAECEHWRAMLTSLLPDQRS